MDAISVKNLSIYYAGGKKSVKECSFSVQGGEVFGLLGSNGAGKSTILMVFAGIIKDFRGDVTVSGEDYRYGGSTSRHVAYVPQSPCMFSDFTVRENLFFYCSMEGLGGGRREKRIDELLSSFSLERFADVPASRLSGGYRQLLNIALSSILDKKIILMDEPTAGLDLWAKRKIVEHIKGLKARGKTVILTTHDLRDAEALCDNVVILSDGKILAKGNIKSMLRELGGGYSIIVKLARDPPAGLSLKHSRIVSVRGRELVTEANPAQVGAALKEVMAKLERSGIEDFDVKEPSLEYVFSSLVARVGK